MVELNGPTDQSEAARATGFIGESAQVQRPVTAGDKPLDCAQVSTDFRNNVFVHPAYNASRSLMGKIGWPKKCVRTRTKNRLDRHAPKHLHSATFLGHAA